MTKQEAMQELASRELEKRFSQEREDLIEFIKTYFKNERPKGIKNFQVSDFHLVIADRLQRVLDGEITRLIINIPPGHGKTELITKSFPVWALGKNPHLQIIATGYSTTLTQGFSSEAKDYYKSPTFKCIFPRSGGVDPKQDTKEHRKTAEGGAYYATGFDGSITGKRANIFIIDDPIKPKEADKSDIIRDGVNNLYSTTVPSRLFDPAKDAIIVIMQRTHDNDLCGYLMDRAGKGGSEREVISMPAIAERDEIWDTKKYGTINRLAGEPLDKYRFPLSTLDILKRDISQDSGSAVWSTQYQQEPVNKETQEFHEEWFKYHGEGTPKETPKGLRIFTAVDPAFKTGQENDQSCIMTVGLIGHEVYILEYTAGRFQADVLQEKIIYHIRKRNPEKVGIEAYQAQSMIGQFLKLELQKKGLYSNIVEIKQTGDKSTKLRKLISPYRNGDIYHKPGMDELELELKRFPRGKHDDIIDSLQMVYEMIELHPGSGLQKNNIRFERDDNGTPILIGN